MAATNIGEMFGEISGRGENSVVYVRYLPVSNSVLLKVRELPRIIEW